MGATEVSRMKPFITIARPHKDILEGRLTEDVFAADLWEVFRGRAPDEYKDPDIFFEKTYMTQGLANLLTVAEKRLKGEGGDPVIQLQTPFGGGKTHSLIALYHKAREWGVNVVVIDGTALDPREVTIWGEMERQLRGEIKELAGNISPGREKLRRLLESHQPLLILMDEILEYTTKASGVKVGETTLAAQVLAFMQELTMTVKALDKTLLVLALPTSLLEHYDESAEKLFRQLQKIVGRVEKIYMPVRDEEVAAVVRRRLFSSIDEKEAKRIIDEFLDYAEREGILPEGVDKAVYREKFIKSYPFQPEVIDVLYKRWGSYPEFQRTRGVLRLLSLVVYSMKESKRPFIALADFDLGNDEIRRELLKYIGPEYDSVIAADITAEDSGAKKVDKSLGETYLPFSFGTRVATTIFLHSFSGGPVELRGATMGDIKLSSVDPAVTSAVIADAVEQLKEKAFYLWYEGGRYFFTNRPNLNRIVLDRMESITDEDVREEEKAALEKNLTKKHFRIFIWPKNSRDVPDTKELKLIVLPGYDEKKCKEIIEKCGEKPRVYVNTLVFLVPDESERQSFNEFIRKKLAWESLEKDKTLTFTDDQMKRIKDKVKELKGNTRNMIRQLYRIVLLPSKDGLTKIDLGIPTYGTTSPINEEVYERLRSEEEIVESLEPLTIKELYLKERDYVKTKNMLESFFRTPGVFRIFSEAVLKDCIKEGVKRGLFGLGEIINGKPVCRYFQKAISPSFTENEILIKAELCSRPESEEKEREISVGTREEEVTEHVSIPEGVQNIYKRIHLKLGVPLGKFATITRIINYLKSKFEDVETELIIKCKNGAILVSDYEDKIKEAFAQAKIKVKEEELD